MVNRTPMRELVQFVTLTTDPEHDTPAVMRDYGSSHGLDPVNWVFLRTTPDQPEDATRKLAERFGHGFTKPRAAARPAGAAGWLTDSRRHDAHQGGHSWLVLTAHRRRRPRLCLDL
jgi:protein SCO1/2